MASSSSASGILGILVALAVVLVTTWFAAAYLKRSKIAAASNGEEDEDGETTTKPTASAAAPPPPAAASAASAAAKEKKRRPIKPSSHPRYVRRFGGHTSNVHCASVSPDGAWMATSGDDSQLRVTKVEKDSQIYLRANVENHDVIVSISWLGDGRTLACAFKRCNDVAFYRMRKKHDDDASKTASFPYELVELHKRRFSASSKMSDDEEMIDVVADRSHSHSSSPFGLVLTHGTGKNAVAWDSSVGKSVAAIRTGGGTRGARMSPDGKFVCGRIEGASNEIKLYEIRRKKIKGEVEPVFDGISSKSATTIVSNAGTRVADVDFFFDSNGVSGGSSDLRAAVVCANGLVQIFDLNVDCRNEERPKLLCETRVDDSEPVCVAASVTRGRIAIATKDRSVRLFTYKSAPTPCLTSDFVIENVHATGVAELHFDPRRPPSSEEKEGTEEAAGGGDGTNFLYTRGASSKEVFMWKVD